MKLCIDTCTNVCTVAAVEENKVLAERTYNDKLKHSEILMVEVEEMLKRLDKTSSDIDSVYVTNGPGSFTGIRIGVTVANTLSDTLKVPIYDYSVLDLIASNFMYTNKTICSMLYARNNRYYFCIYSSSDEKLEMLREYDVLDVNEIIEEIKSNYDEVIFAGDIDLSHYELLKSNGILVNPSVNIPKASVLPFVNIVGKKEMNQNEKINDMFVRPLYLEKSQAEKMMKND